MSYNSLEDKRTPTFIFLQRLQVNQNIIDPYHATALAGIISAVLEHDTGTARILTIGLHQDYEARKTVDTTLASLRELKLIEPRMERHYGSDYASFNEVGVPGFPCIGDESDYDKTHDTQADTFDKVREDGIIQANF